MMVQISLFLGDGTGVLRTFHGVMNREEVASIIFEFAEENGMDIVTEVERIQIVVEREAHELPLFNQPAR